MLVLCILSDVVNDVMMASLIFFEQKQSKFIGL